MNIKEKLFATAIAIVLVAFITVGIETFYKQPENPCYKAELIPKTFSCDFLQESNKTECYKQERNFYEDQSRINQKCYDEFKPIEDNYKRNVFIILITIGVLITIFGLFLKDVPSVYLGLMFGGIISILQGIIRYWANMNEYLRFVILGILLAILIWISYKKLK